MTFLVENASIYANRTRTIVRPTNGSVNSTLLSAASLCDYWRSFNHIDLLILQLPTINIPNPSTATCRVSALDEHRGRQRRFQPGALPRDWHRESAPCPLGMACAIPLPISTRRAAGSVSGLVLAALVRQTHEHHRRGSGQRLSGEEAAHYLRAACRAGGRSLRRLEIRVYDIQLRQSSLSLSCSFRS